MQNAKEARIITKLYIIVLRVINVASDKVMR
jgi:hypothetical protein